MQTRANGRGRLTKASLGDDIGHSPLVSVVVPTHNRKEAAIRCLNSIIQSNYPNIEIVVRDDLPNALMVRREVFDSVGYFDERNFPIHLDEADLCRRALLRGFRTIVVPRASLSHDIPVRSFGRRGLRSLHLQSTKRTYYLAR